MIRIAIAAILVATTCTAADFYVDPTRGTMAGDGSQAKPWRTLAEVVAAKLINGEDPAVGRVHAGDTIYLMSGSHGAVSLTTYSGKFANTSPITVQAYAGERPVITQLTVRGAKNWIFRGITFQPTSVGKWFTLVTLTSCDKITLDNNTLQTKADVSDWTPDDWLTLAVYSALNVDGTNCVITNNKLRHIRKGIGLAGDGHLVANNVIDHFANDAIDITSSNTTLQRNAITNHYGKVLDGNHNDAIQGWTVNGAVNVNTVIDGNYIVSSTGAYADTPLPSGEGQDSLQGISIFDGEWRALTITNNVVGASAYHGIAMYGVQDCVICNNTVFNDSTNPSLTAWITVAPGKGGVLIPSEVVVMNNIAELISLPKPVAGGTIVDHHNLAFRSNSTWSKDPSNIVVTDKLKVFRQFDPVSGRFDLRLVSGVPDGVARSWLAFNVLGEQRSTPTIGAY